MAERVAQLEVEVGVDLGRLKANLSKVGQQFDRLGNQMQNLGRSLSVRVTAPLLAIGTAAVKAASDAEEMQAKFDTVFKNVGGEVTAALDEFAKAAGRSRFELRGMAAQLGDVLKPLGFTEEEAGNLSVSLTKLATDLASFNNMTMDEALQRLRGTLVGSHENALAFGVVIKENTLKAELARMGLDDLTGAALEQAKVQARLNLLMQGTTDAQGDAIRTSGSFANQMRTLRDEVRDLGVEIGRELLPVAQDLLGWARDAVTAFSNLSDGTKTLVVQTGLWVAALGPLLSVGGKLLTIIRPLGAWMWKLAGAMAALSPVVLGLAGVLTGWVGIMTGVSKQARTTTTDVDAMTEALKRQRETMAMQRYGPLRPDILAQAGAGGLIPAGAFAVPDPGAGGGGGGGTDPAEQVETTMDRAMKAQRAVKDEAQKWAAAVWEAKEAAGFVTEEMDLTLPAFDAINETTLRVKHNMANWRAAIEHAGKAVDNNLADSMKRVSSSLAYMVGQIASMQMAFDEVGKTLKKIAQQEIASLVQRIAYEKILLAIERARQALKAGGGIASAAGALFGLGTGFGAFAVGAGLLYAGSRLFRGGSGSQQVQLQGTVLSSNDIYISQQGGAYNASRTGRATSRVYGG